MFKLISNLQCKYLVNFSQAVRWHRKPRWFPVAKSKMFKVPSRPDVPENELRELRRLYNNYRAEIKAIRCYMVEQYKPQSNEVSSTEDIKLFESDLATRSKINDEWNLQRAAEREKRLTEQREKNRIHALERIARVAEEEKKRLAEIEEMVRAEKEAAKTFIARENIEEAIEKILANPVDHNYAIDIRGNYYHGRATNPETVEQQ